ncbi:spherulation-specific family 4 protein [Streptacidiphilus jiangxiensis]|uniref:Spherulation-specific family 4 n=1 Tax=Streptacidiphilus jiangxiensis TaxID=235985 RepID=A0A1H7GED0_STRJI|nr:spherulation-specific family 4 protein [Streptacidiphilus jiangxiensis]SEK35212.1 Spherulation-specific family 4 [Streptacidiphilus jiangxiensis]
MSDDPISRLLVPAYFHPAVEPEAWAALRVAAPRLAAVVVNPASGPGSAPDPAYREAVAGLRATRVLGYVDTDYGRRPHAEVVAEIAAYREWYAVDGVFLDQTPDGSAALPHYDRLAIAARSLGATFLVLNPGLTPHPAYLDLADLVVTFEGPWCDYENRAEDAGCHLVYAAPPDASVHGYATSGTLPNPWAVLGLTTDRVGGSPPGCGG